MTTLKDWAVARVIQEYDFPKNAAEEIVKWAIESDWYRLLWTADLNKHTQAEIERAWFFVTTEINWMSRTDLTEAQRIRMFEDGAKVIYEGKDMYGKVLIVRADHMGRLEEYKDKIRKPGRQVLVRRVCKNTWRIFNRKIFKEENQ